jgi:tRNA(Ile)-lysidine synthase
VIPFARNVQEILARYKMAAAEDRILVGVSGGADSVALLSALRELGHDLAIAHLNHGLRGAEADEDEQFVADLAAEMRIRCFIRRAALSARGGNVEAAGRSARKEFFDSLKQEHGFTKIALAHNQEDRVETFLLHLMRGAGSEGLVSMAPVNGTIIRPLIETSRTEIENYLKTQNQKWRTDRTNSDISFARNRMRHEIIPLLASLFNTRLVESLSRTMSVLEDEDAWMSAMVQAWLGQYDSDNGIDVKALRGASPALARRVIRARLRQAGSHLKDLTFDHVEAVRSLLHDGKSGKMIPLPGGLTAAREFDGLMFLKGEGMGAEFDYELPIPGTVRIPELGRLFRAEQVEKPEDLTKSGQSPARVFVDGSRLGACVNIRNWKPGDYYKPAGWPAGKVKKLFQRARIPRSKRGRWPIFVTDATIVWVASFPVSREFIPGGHSEKIVAFEALPD